MNEIDRDALERALVACRAESAARAKQLDSNSTMNLGKRSRSLPVIAHRVVRWISCRGSRRPVTPISAP